MLRELGYQPHNTLEILALDYEWVQVCAKVPLNIISDAFFLVRMSASVYPKVLGEKAMNNYIVGYVIGGSVFIIATILYFFWSKPLSAQLENDLKNLKLEREKPKKGFLLKIFKK